MFGPPSSPPVPRDAEARTVAAGLLPAFAPQSDSPQPTRKFLRPKFSIYRDPEPQTTFLPTPLPTSEANMPASSSPPLSPVQEAASAVSLARSKPLQPLIVARVPLSGSAVTLGRSSKSSTFALRASNKLASRVHARLSVNAENYVVIECLGWNGLTVSVADETTGAREDYTVERGQILNVERVDGIMMEVHGDKVLVEYVNDAEETEEEVWKQSDEGTVPPAKKLRSDASRDALQPALSMDSLAAPKINTLGPAFSGRSLLEADDDAKLPPTLKGEDSPKASSRLGQPLQASHTLEVPIAKSATTNRAKQATPEPDSQQDPTSNSGVSTPASVGEKRKRAQDLSPEVLRELENVAANYVAFSRLSAVPLATVRKASSQLQALPKSQVREIIRGIKCIGVTDAERDDFGRLPEDEYYYIPELDESEERRSVVQSTRGHRSLRSCRKTHKQYFYRPLNLTE